MCLTKKKNVNTKHCNPNQFKRYEVKGVALNNFVTEHNQQIIPNL